MEPSCSVCSAPATCFCSCRSFPTPLCTCCRQTHLSTPTRNLHRFLPLSLYSLFHTAEYQSKVQGRIEGIEAGQVALLSNLKAIDQCLAEACEMGETAEIAELREKRGELESAIQRSVEEAEWTVYEDFPYLKQPFTVLLRDYADLQSAALQVFSYEISREKSLGSLSYSLTYLNTSPPEQLYRLFKDSLLLYNLSTDSTRTISLSSTFSNESRYCFPSPNTLISIGGIDVVSVDLTSFQLTQHNRLESPHSYPGLIAINQETYIFGGETVRCEKLRADYTSSPLPDMKVVMDGFSPCRYRDEVYLPAYQTNYIEVFSLITYAFRTLRLQLPNITDNSVSFISAETLFILTCSHQFAYIVLSCDSVFTTSTLQLKDSNSGQAACPPVLIGHRVYWFAAWTGDLVTFDLETKTVTELKLA